MKDNNDNNDEWERLWVGVHEMADWFSEGMVMIGGLAVWLHAKQSIESRLLDVSHDADFYLSLSDYIDLREIEEVTFNRRLKKHQIIKDGVDYDIYVERENGLKIPYDRALASSVMIDGIRCASLEHLLVLKYAAWEDREKSAKGAKDARDIVRILITLNSNEQYELSNESLSFLPDNAIDKIKSAVNTPSIFLEITHGNSHEARKIQRHAQCGAWRIEACISMRDDTDSEDHEEQQYPEGKTRFGF